MSANGVEKHISKPGLEKLLKAADVMDSATATERAAFADKITKAIKDDHLDKWAFRIVRQLYKLDPAKAAFRIRALTLYIDLLGLAAQTDLEDMVEKAAAEKDEGD